MIIWDSSIFEEVDWSPLNLHKFGDGYVFNTRHGLEYDDVVRYVNTEGLRALADAIYTELGLGWLPYPENVPEKGGKYKITALTLSTKPEPFVTFANFVNSENRFDTLHKVVAYAEADAPYQP